jgi:hypothetical protein
MYLYIHIHKNIYIFIGVYNTSKHPDGINGRKTSHIFIYISIYI